MAEVLKLLNSDNEVEYLRSWLRSQVREQGLTGTFFAKEMGYSNHTAVSQFINGQRASKNFIEKLREIKEKVDSTEKPSAGSPPEPAPAPENEADPAPGYSKLIKTEDLKRVMGLCSMCAKDRSIGLVTGQAGTGKTTALQEYAQRDPFNVRYIRAEEMMAARDFLDEIIEALGMEPIGGTTCTKKKAIIQCLKRKPVLLIIDEADYLASSTSIAKIEMLRTMWDKARSGVVLAGTRRLAEVIVKGPGGKENLSQLYSRIRRSYTMQGVSRDEILLYLGKFDVAASAKEYLVAVATSKARGGLRRFTMLWENISDMLEAGEKISLSLVKEAEKLLTTPEAMGLEF